jgi:NitT/TauT family transport system substrate-binding protein
MILHHMLGGQPNEAGKTIETKYISPSYLNKSLSTHNIDAFICAEPWNTKAVLDGTGRILAQSGDIYPGHICCVLVVRESFAAQQGDILGEYLRLLLAANEQIASRPDFCAKIQANYTGVSADVVETIIRKKIITYHDLVPDKNRIESIMNLSISAGILKQPCDLNSFMRTDFL